MKIIIAGAGEVGRHLVKLLAYDNHEITVIDVNDQELQLLSNQVDILTITGTALSIPVLQSANVDECDLFIAVTHFPEMNLACSVLAKKLGAPKTIARVRDPEVLDPKIRKIYEEVGVDSIIYPQVLAALEIEKLVTHSASREFFNFADDKLSLYVFKVEEKDPIVGKYLHETIADKSDLENYRIIAIKREYATIIPRGDDIVKPNDIVYVMSNKFGVQNMLQMVNKKKIPTNKIMILGGSRTGRATANILQNNFDVTLIEIDSKKSKTLASQLNNTLIINGDGRNADLLVEEGIRNTDVFIATTSNSETNILSCYLAKRLGVKRVIAEIENMDYLGVASDMGITTTINKKTIAANVIRKHTLSKSNEIESTRQLLQTEAQIFEINVHHTMKVTNSDIKSLEFPRGVVIGGVIKGKSAFIPSGTTRIEPGDRVIVFALPNTVQEMKKFFQLD